MYSSTVSFLLCRDGGLPSFLLDPLFCALHSFLFLLSLAPLLRSFHRFVRFPPQSVQHNDRLACTAKLVRLRIWPDQVAVSARADGLQVLVAAGARAARRTAGLSAGGRWPLQREAVRGRPPALQRRQRHRAEGRRGRGFGAKCRAVRRQRALLSAGGAVLGRGSNDTNIQVSQLSRTTHCIPLSYRIGKLSLLPRSALSAAQHHRGHRQIAVLGLL